MNRSVVHSLVLLAAGFAAGVSVNAMGSASAVQPADAINPSQKRLIVSIDEVQQNFVFAEEFSGRYRKTVTLSDGSVRRIDLVPMLMEGKFLVRFNDNDGHTYMPANGTTTNGKLMVQLRDLAQQEAEFGALASR